MGRPLKTGPKSNQELQFRVTMRTLKRFHALKREGETATDLLKRFIASEEARREYTDEKGFLTIIDPKTGEKVKIAL